MTEPTIPLDRVAKFIRQLTHDVRNGLSAIDLEAAFIAEIATEKDVLAETRKLRDMIAETAQLLRGISQYFQPVNAHCIPWSATAVMEEIRKHLGIEPENRFTNETLHIDLLQTLTALTALVKNAQEPPRLTGFVENNHAVLELREPKTIPPISLEEWGIPLYTTRTGSYGLGLYQAKKIADAQNGVLEIQWRDGMLITRLTLPLEASENF